MTNILWLQMPGAIAGGLVGSLAGLDPGCLEAALELAVLQRSELVELMDSGRDLLRRLAEQAGKLTI